MNLKHISLKAILPLSLLAGSLSSCSDKFLEEKTYGEINPDQITDAVNVERVIIGAYKILNGQMDGATNAMNSPASNWSFGDVMSDDCYKGGGGTGDQAQVHRMEIYQTDPTIIDMERKWAVLYEGIKRTNDAIRILTASANFDPQLKIQRNAELHFLRGHYYFELKRIYNRIPYIDETVENAQDFAKSNTEFTSEEIWAKIEADFQKAYDALPATQSEPGRPTKMAAKAYLAKTYLYQQKWQQTYDAATEVMNSQVYGLESDFQTVFLPENDNGKEVIFAVQHSINDGQPSSYNGSIGDRLISPGGPFYAQYGFQRPTQNLVNAFKTNAQGLPVGGNVNITSTDYVDPRLDITVARPGIAFKDMDILYSETWARDLATYGPFSPKKRVVSAKSSHYSPVWPYVNALNYYIIRYAEVVLWRAEAAVETGRIDEARTLVNQIRQRAKNSAYVKTLDGSANAANYNVEVYTQAWTNADQARDAVRLESRLELALEGQRFFNLVRWGIAAKVINQDYLPTEKTRRSFLANANFTAGKNEYFPIPQRYVDGSPKGMVTQNPNY
jgi:hypothetical protein